MANATTSLFGYDTATTIPNFAMFLERALNPYKTATLRVPFYMTSTWRQRNNIKGVSMLMNPNAVSFRQEKRITERSTQWGRVFYHWTNTAGRNDDVLRLEFSGQTGNIGVLNGTRGKGMLGFNPAVSAAGQATQNFLQAVGGLGDDDTPGALRAAGANVDMSGASKLANFHNLWSLTREPVMDPVNGIPVYYYITYTSPLFGNTLVTFVGHFSRPLEIMDDANDPFNKRYSFGFVVHDSVPSPDLLYQTVLQNLTLVFSNNVSG